MRKLVLVIMALVLLSSLVVIAQETTHPEIGVQKGDYVFIGTGGGGAHWELMVAGIQAAAELFDPVPNVKFLSSDNKNDADGAVALLRAATAAEPAAIAVVLFDPSAFDTAVQEAIDAGIMVVGFHMDDWTNNPRQAYIGYNWENMAQEWTGHMTKHMLPGSHVAIVTPLEAGPIVRRKIKGIIAALGDYNIGYVMFPVGKSASAVAGIMAGAVTDCDGIIATTDFMTNAVAEYVQANNLNDELLVGGFVLGVEPLACLENGSLDVAMRSVPTMEGGFAFEVLYYSTKFGVFPSEVTLHGKLECHAEE